MLQNQRNEVQTSLIRQSLFFFTNHIFMISKQRYIMTNLKLYGVVGRASSWEVKVEDSTARLLEVNSLLDIGKECYELKSMIEEEDLFMLNLCPAKKPILPDHRKRLRIDDQQDMNLCVGLKLVLFLKLSFKRSVSDLYVNN